GRQSALGDLPSPAVQMGAEHHAVGGSASIPAGCGVFFDKNAEKRLFGICNFPDAVYINVLN
ncbi:MAG: hypothetical protein IKO93_18110, partial [Lentisphaeria bacterium]|nr:hypothetical protein [Lentisphaeria bacterium]